MSENRSFTTGQRQNHNSAREPQPRDDDRPVDRRRWRLRCCGARLKTLAFNCWVNLDDNQLMLDELKQERDELNRKIGELEKKPGRHPGKTRFRPE